MSSTSLLLFLTGVVSLGWAYEDLGNGAVVSKVVNPGPVSKINILESGDGDVKKGSNKDRNAVGNEMRWINGVVPYAYDASVTSKDVKAAIDAAIADYHKFTCIKFRPKTASDPDWVVFTDGAGCSSNVGRIQQGGQKVTLSSAGCQYKGTVIHELMHAIGFDHEQCRPDRNDFIIVDLDQVPKDKQHNFQMLDGKDGTVVGRSFGFKYDFGSIMHYSNMSFSSTSKPSMRRKDGQPLIVQSAGFGDYDIKKINIYYGCDTGKPPAPANEFTTVAPKPPAEWGCKKIVYDPSCENISRKCTGGGYRTSWNGLGDTCTMKCSCS
jgi:hypothetical protein